MITYYKGNYKYQLALRPTDRHISSRGGGLWLCHELRFTIQKEGSSTYLQLRKSDEGVSYLFIKNGYAWDGASGPTIDTRDTQRASLVHDALWQLIETGHLPESFRPATNKEFLYTLLKTGVPAWRARAWYFAVSTFGSFWVRHFGRNRQIKKAP